MRKKIRLAEDLRAASRARATKVRRKLEELGVLMVNLIGSPGSGKTSLLEATLPRLTGVRSAVIEGDVETSRDAQRIRALGIPCVQINTGGGCHLVAEEVERAVEEVGAETVDMLFIENVGNLVCPATADVGEDCKVAVLSVPEGDDKVAKYPRLFREAQCVVLNKVDLMGVVKFRMERVRDDLAKVNPEVRVLRVSAATGEGVEAWVEWLHLRRRHKRA